jgi:hypothetical protein
MKWTIFIAMCSCVFLTACNNVNPSKSAGIATSEKTKISFGVYDISRGPSLSDLFSAPREPLLQKGIALTSTTAETQNTDRKVVDAEKATVRQTDVAGGQQRKVVKNAEIHLESADPDVLQKSIISIAESQGGFVLSTEQSMSDVTTNVRDSISITVRVPAEKFTNAVESIRGSADRFLVESIKGEDVTEEFVDLAARLKSKRALESQFLEILKQSETVDDALSVQSRLTEVRTEIEKIEGRMRFLENQTEYSTIRINVQTPSSITPHSAGVVYRFGESIGGGFNAALNFTLGLVTFVIGVSPFLLFVGLPGYLVGRKLWPRKSRSAAEIAKEEIKDE